MKFWVVLLAAAALGVGCDVGSGKLTGTGGGTIQTGSGGDAIMTGSGGIATGNGGGIETGSGGAGPVGSGGQGGPPIGPCDTMYPAEPLPPDVVILLDTSTSMNDGFNGRCAGGCGVDSKWNAAATAIDSVVSAPEPAVRWALQMMNYGGDACAAAGVIGGLGTDVTGIRAEIAGRSMGGLVTDPSNSPTRAAISAAVDYFGSMSTTPNDHIIVLVTDGLPDCGQNAADPLASDATATTQAITGARQLGVRTLVAGLAIPAEATSALSAMALEGGLARSGFPLYFPVSNSAELVTVIRSLVTQTTACTFAVPAPPVDIGLSRGNIGVFLDGKQIAQDGNDGWHYRDANLSAIQLVGPACAAANAGGAVTVVFRCLIP